MATLVELLDEIRQLLTALSSRFDELAQEIAGLESSDSDPETRDFQLPSEPEPVESTDDTQSLEPPPLDEVPQALSYEVATPPENPDEDTKTVEADEPKTSEMKAVAREGASMETAEIKADEEILAPPPTAAGALPLLEKLARLQEIVTKKELEVSAKDFAFVPKSTEVYASLSGEGRVGPKGARIVLDCINFLDSIDYKYVGDYYSSLREAVAALTRSLSEFLQREVGYKIFPLGQETRGEIEAVVPDYSAAVQEKQTYSSAPAGTVVAVRRRGAILDNNVVRKAQLLVSSGEQTKVSSLLEAGLNAVSSLKASSERSAEMKLKGMGSIIEWRDKLSGASEDHAMTVVRYAMNLLHTLENPTGVASGEIFPGQTQKLKKVNDRMVSLLRSAGLSEIIVSVGGVFDESYDPSKYERKKVASDKPEGAILGVLRRGFLDRNGIPVQKAVVAVSGK